MKPHPLAGNISIDREGNWRHEGVRITHERTIELFFKSLKSIGEDRFIIEIGEQSAPVEVADTPLIVLSVRETETGLDLLLSDKSREPLDVSTLRQNEDNVLYCRVRDGEFSARFSRPAYYLLTDLIQPTDDGSLDLVVGEKRIRLPIRL